MERKRELFQRYLDEKKVNDLLSKIIVSLYEINEKPSDPLQYIRDYLAETDRNVDLIAIHAENEKLKKKVDELTKKLAVLTDQLEQKTAKESVKLEGTPEETPQ